MMRITACAALLLAIPVAPDPAWTVGGTIGYNATFGSVVASGDVDGDGHVDMIVAAVGLLNQVEILVYPGGPSGPSTTAIRSSGPSQAGSGFGRKISTGDVNGDGISDLLVTAPSYDHLVAEEGALFVYHGHSPGGLSTTPDWVAYSFRYNAQLGMSGTIAADVNGDGFDDVVAGAPNFDNGETLEGALFVWLGSLEGLPVGADGETAPPAAQIIESNTVNAVLGYELDAVGNVNGDLRNGRPLEDVVAVAPGIYGGRAFVYRGSATGLDGSAPWMFASPVQNASAAGDVDGDSFDDVLLGSPAFDAGGSGAANYGRVAIHRGGALGPSGQEFWSIQGDLPGTELGRTLAPAGDVNGDGFADVVVGAPERSGDFSTEGAIYLYLGGEDGPGADADWSMVGGKYEMRLGRSLASAGDANNDGVDDLLIGARAWLDPVFTGGKVMIFHGITPFPSKPEGLEQRKKNGVDLIPAGGGTAGIGAKFLAELLDPQAQDVRLQVEVRELGSDFTGTPTATGPSFPSGAVASATVSGLVLGGQYRWQARAIDPEGKASAWVSFGSNEDMADFVVTEAPPAPPESDSGSTKPCEMSAAGTPAAWALLAASILALGWRRRGILPCMLALGVLAGCGGDSGGSSGPAPEVAPVFEITPQAAWVNPGWSAQFSAHLRHPDGTFEAVPVIWTTRDGSIVTIDSSGKVTGVSAGQTTIKAVSQIDAGQVAVAAVEVAAGDRVFGIDENAGLVSYPLAGGDRAIHPLALAGGAIKGVAVAGNDVYLLVLDGMAAKSTLWRYDIVDGSLSSVPEFSIADDTVNLVLDNEGRFVTITVKNVLHRFDPSEGVMELLGTLPGFAVNALAVDADGYLYTQNAIPTSEWVVRHDVSGPIVSTMVVAGQGELGSAFGSGLAVTTFGGPIYVADASRKLVFAGIDGNGDKAYTSGGEFEPCAPTFAEPWGLLRIGADLLVSDYSENAVYRMTDLDGDFSFLGASEGPQEWGRPGVVTGNTANNLALWKVQPQDP